MIRRTLAAVSTAGLLFGLAPLAPATAADTPEGKAGTTPKLAPATATSAGSMEKTGPVISLGKGAGKQLYVVQLDQPAVPTRASATDDAGRTLAKAPAESGYRTQIKADQADLQSRMRSITGGQLAVRYTYTEALNGFAVELTRAEAAKVAQLDGVGAVQVDKIHQLTTDVGPEWIGAPTIWDGSNVPGGTGTKGEGVIAGIIDSGINPANPSFADTIPADKGGDGYDHTNPFGPGNYKGMCNPDNTLGSPKYVADWGCNDKLIGYYNFTTDNSPYDDDGHGSHTGSTTAGNQLEVTTYAGKGTEHEFSTTETIKGVAPHANVIGYDVCDGGCSGAAIVAAINQSIADGVDVINYSIGSASPSSPWTNVDAVGFLNARAAGIHVATSAGNAGPGAATLGSPGDVPWMTTVGASQHDRQWQAHVTDITADGGATLADIDGVGFAKASAGAFPIVDAATLGSKLCLKEQLTGQDLSGKIILCERGTTGRVEKGEVVSALGAEGMVLMNDAASGDSLNADAHVLPAVHITHDDGVALRAWLTGKTNAKVALSGGQRHVGDDVADIMAAFSSRGPNRAVSIISPSVSAPGVDILAAEGVDNEVAWAFMSGTSMASPHTAGALALLAGARENWTPAEAQSALMTTSVTAIKDNDGTDADWHDMGSGRIDLTKAAKAGVLFDVTDAEYKAADPAKGGDVRTLNLASMADNDCLGECSWTRTATATDTGVGTWTVSVENLTDNVELSVASTSLTFGAAGDSADLEVTAKVSGDETWGYGTVVLTPPAGSSAPVAHLPVAVLPSNGVLPEAIDVTTRRDAGSQPSEGLRVAADTEDVTFVAGGLVPGDVKTLDIAQDTTNDDAWDDLSQVSVTKVTVPAGATRLVASLGETASPDMDLYVGTGEVTEANVVAESASAGSAETVDLASPEAGEYWILVQNWEASDAGHDTVDLSTAVVSGNEGNLKVEGPSANVPAGDPFSVRTFWDEDKLEAGQTWYGAVDLQAGGTSLGVIPVSVHRTNDDVTKSADKAEAKPGDVVTYTVDIAENVTPEDLEYSITDTIPAGMTYVEGSATDGATYADGKVSWTGTMASPVNAAGSYEWSTSKNDPTCVNPVSGTPEYVDLLTASGGAIKTQAGVEGDTELWTAFGTYSFGHYGAQAKSLSISDDGLIVRDPTTGWGGQPWVPQQVPNAAKPNGLNALLWQDMQITYDAATNKGLSLATVSEGGAGTPVTHVVMEYDDVHLLDTPAQSYDAEIIVPVGSSDVFYAYDNIVGPLGEVTIGAENADGTAGHALVNKGNASQAIANDTVVCGRYAEAQVGAKKFTYQVTVDAGATGVLTNSAEHTVDNPGAKPAVAKTDVKVSGSGTGTAASSTALTLTPTSVAAGGTTTAKATVTGTGGTPTGKVDFLVNGAVAGSGTLAADGTVSASLKAPATAGTYPVVAQYAGDATFKPSTSAAVSLAVTGSSAKVKPTIKVKTPKKVKVGAKGKKVKVTVSATGTTPTGKVKVVIKGAGKKKITRTVKLNRAGKATIKLPRFTKVGKVKVKVKYAGDASVLAGKAKATFKVVRR